MTIIDTINTMLAPRKVRWSLAFLCFALAGFVFWRDVYPVLTYKHPAADPVYYADGSVEYDLIDGTQRDIQHPSQRHSWVLRFPDLIECREATADGKCTSYKKKRILPRYKKISSSHKPPISTQSFNFLVNLADFLIVTERERGYRAKTILLDPSGRYEPLFEKKYSGRADDFVESGFGKTAEWEPCKLLKEITPNFHQVRQATEEEIAREYKGPPSGLAVKCLNIADDTDGYRLVNAEGRKVARGYCFIAKSEATKENTSCGFFVWLPQERLVQLQFGSQHLQQFPEIYQKVVKLFNDVTVIEKSKNIKWRPSADD